MTKFGSASPLSNLLREAAGAPVLNYLGESYGTGLGATYASLFPATTGHMVLHMVLDGNLDPVAWTHPDGALPTFLRLDTDQASAETMRAFLDLCGKATTSACAFSAGTPAATRAKRPRCCAGSAGIRSRPRPWPFPPPSVAFTAPKSGAHGRIADGGRAIAPDRSAALGLASK